jgi:hypothetical protein
MGRYPASNDRTFRRRTQDQFERYAAYIANWRHDVVAGKIGWENKLRREVDRSLTLILENRIGDLNGANPPEHDSLVLRSTRLVRLLVVSVALVAAGIGVLLFAPSGFSNAGFVLMALGGTFLVLPLIGTENLKPFVDLIITFLRPGRNS